MDFVSGSGQCDLQQRHHARGCVDWGTGRVPLTTRPAIGRSSRQNPNGVWGYGYLPAGAMDSTKFVPFTQTFDGIRKSVGSLSNPGSTVWEDVLADKHPYQACPHTAAIIHTLRTIDGGGRPLFISEYGFGSANNLIHLAGPLQSGEPSAMRSTASSWTSTSSGSATTGTAGNWPIRSATWKTTSASVSPWKPEAGCWAPAPFARTLTSSPTVSRPATIRSWRPKDSSRRFASRSRVFTTPCRTRGPPCGSACLPNRSKSCAAGACTSRPCW